MSDSLPLQSQQVHQKFEELLTSQAQYQASVVEEQKAIESLDQKIRQMEREISRQRKDMGG